MSNFFLEALELTPFDSSAPYSVFVGDDYSDKLSFWLGVWDSLLRELVVEGFLEPVAPFVAVVLEVAFLSLYLSTESLFAELAVLGFVVFFPSDFLVSS